MHAQRERILACPNAPTHGFRNLIGKPTTGDEVLAAELRVTVTKQNQVVVDVALPARSARWLIELIPVDVMTKIKAEGIPIEEIQKDLAERPTLIKTKIFNLIESERSVQVWLE